MAYTFKPPKTIANASPALFLDYIDLVTGKSVKDSQQVLLEKFRQDYMVALKTAGESLHERINLFTSTARTTRLFDSELVKPLILIEDIDNVFPANATDTRQQVRTGKQEEPSYSLDAILKNEQEVAHDESFALKP